MGFRTRTRRLQRRFRSDRYRHDKRRRRGERHRLWCHDVELGGSHDFNVERAPSDPGQGSVRPDLWAVVYKVGNLTINAGATLRFLNHPTNAPVVILVQGDFICNGAIDLSGSSANSIGGLAPAGPGGFMGGSGENFSLSRSAGSGPGGGYVAASAGGGGSYQTLGGGQSGPTYGALSCIPLIGGSGGAGGLATVDGTRHSGGGGGGALLIAVRGNTTFGAAGTIASRGGDCLAYYTPNSGGGSGGAFRLITNALSTLNTSVLDFRGGASATPGGGGRILIETNSGSFIGQIAGAAPSVAVPGGTAQLWPLNTAPTAKVARIGSIFIGSDPQGGFGLPDAVVSSAAAQLVRVECTNVPVDGTWAVQVRVTPRFGNATNYVAVLQPGGTPGFSVWTVSVPFGVGSATVIGRAYRIS